MKLESPLFDFGDSCESANVCSDEIANTFLRNFKPFKTNGKNYSCRLSALHLSEIEILAIVYRITWMVL